MGYGYKYGEYCDSTDPPPVREFLSGLRPNARLGISEDTDLGHNATVCFDFYDDIHNIFVDAQIGIIEGEDWMPEFLREVSRIDFGGEMSGRLLSGTMGQMCPSIIERAKARQNGAKK